MKKIIMLLLAGTAFCGVQAQQLSGGFRTGASHWMDREGEKFMGSKTDGRNVTWDKELFVRYHTAGKLAFEASMGYYALNNIDADTRNEQYYDFNIREKSRNMEWNLSAQYDLTCPAMKSCPVLKSIKSYAGIVVTPTLTRYTTEFRSLETGNVPPKEIATGSRDEFSVWTGLTHTLVYDLCRHIYLTSAVRLQIDPNRFFEKDPGISAYPDSRLGLQIGAGYNFR